MTSIFRVKKETNYSILSNGFIQDESLSWKATGMLTYLLHLPDDWKISSADLAKRKIDGRDSTKATLKELVDAKYVIYKKSKDAKGKWLHEYFVYEKPQTENPSTDNPSTENPPTENPSVLVSTNEPSTKELSTKEEIHKSADDKKPINKQTAMLDLLNTLSSRYESLKVPLWNYWRMRVAKGLTDLQWQTILEDLETYASSEDEMIEWINTAFSGGYMTIVPPWKKKKQIGKRVTPDNTKSYNRKQKLLDDTEPDLATDDDGNVIVF